LLHRYGNIDYVLKLPIPRAINLIETAQRELTKEYIFRMYLVDRPNMSKEKFLNFNEYYEKYKPIELPKEKISKKEIIEDVIRIQKRFN